MKKGLTEYYKQVNSKKGVRNLIDALNKSSGSKVVDKDKETVDIFRKIQNKQAARDLKYRSKALNDKEMRDSKIYKNI